MIGRILNHRYRVTNLIGTGGMAHVYRAVNLGTRKSVAIKVLKEEYKDNPEFLRRFEREARAVLHLSHDNIVRAYGVGQEDGCRSSCSSTSRAGRSSRSYRRRPLPLGSHRACLPGARRAVGCGARAGIIHRDIKPRT